MKNRDTAFGKYKTFNIINPIIQSNKNDVFMLSTNSIEKYKSNIYTLLFTGIGERVMMPNFGTNIRNLLFEQMADDIFLTLEQEIIDKVSYWIPEIVVDNIEFPNMDTNIENNQISIKILFSLKNDSTIQDFIELEMGV